MKTDPGMAKFFEYMLRAGAGVKKNDSGAVVGVIEVPAMMKEVEIVVKARLTGTTVDFDGGVKMTLEFKGAEGEVVMDPSSIEFRSVIF